MIKSCRNTHIAIIQCLYKDLAYQYVQFANIGSHEVECLSLKMKVVSKYLSMMYCYKVLDTDLTYAYKFDVSDLTYAEITDIQNAIDLLSIYYTSYDTDGNYLYVYSYNVGALHADVLVAIATVTSTILTETDIINTPNFLLDLWNCITYTEFCNIINHAYSLIEISKGVRVSTSSISIRNYSITSGRSGALTNTFYATAGQTTFIATFTITTSSKVYIGGVRVTGGYAYSGSTLIFTVGLPLGTEVIVDQW